MAMDTKMGPSYANLFVGYIEQQLFNQYNYYHRTWSKADLSYDLPFPFSENKSKKVSLGRLQTNPRKAQNTLDSSIYNFISHARLKIIRKSSLFADPVQRFPLMARIFLLQCAVLKTRSLQKATII